jgi:hypothetical protein
MYLYRAQVVTVTVTAGSKIYLFFISLQYLQ